MSCGSYNLLGRLQNQINRHPQHREIKSYYGQRREHCRRNRTHTRARGELERGREGTPSWKLLGEGMSKSYALEQMQAECVCVCVCMCVCVCVCVCSWEAGGKVYRWEGMQGGGVERDGGERTACMKLQTKDRKW